MSSPVLYPPPPPQMPPPARPTGLTLAAVSLALLAGLGVLSALSIIFTGIFVHTPQPVPVPALAAIQIGMGIAMLAVSAFGIAVVVGLFRVQPWARISILVLGSIQAFFCAIFSAIFIGMAFVPSLTKSNPILPPAMMKGFFVGIGLFYLCFAALGVWWIIYFNLRRVYALFRPDRVAVQPGFYHYAARPVLYPPAAPGRSGMDVALNCFGYLCFVSLIFVILIPLFHLPLFLLGFVLRGAPATIFAVSLALAMAALGVGILRRNRHAWTAAFVFQSFGLASSLALLLPGNQAKMLDYQKELAHRMTSWIPAPAPIPPAAQTPSPANLLFSMLLGVAIGVAVLWFLWRARPLFDKPAAAPVSA